MLPPAHRMRSSADFRAVTRSALRTRRGALIVHHEPAVHLMPNPRPALVGLVVGKSVGGSVVRHRVSRRLRAQLAARLDQLPVGSATVVRALPAAAAASSATLAGDLDAALRRVLRDSR